MTSTEIRPYRVEIPQSALDDLAGLAAARCGPTSCPVPAAATG